MLNVDYFLLGVVDHCPGHYVGFKRRITHIWDKCDGLALNKKINTNINRDTTIHIHILIYVKIVE